MKIKHTPTLWIRNSISKQEEWRQTYIHRKTHKTNAQSDFVCDSQKVDKIQISMNRRTDEPIMAYP